MKNTTVIAIICITILSGIAMFVGFNGAFLGIALAAISGLGGYQIRANTTTKGGT